MNDNHEPGRNAESAALAAEAIRDRIDAIHAEHPLPRHLHRYFRDSLPRMPVDAAQEFRWLDQTASRARTVATESEPSADTIAVFWIRAAGTLIELRTTWAGALDRLAVAIPSPELLGRMLEPMSSVVRALDDARATLTDEQAFYLEYARNVECHPHQGKYRLQLQKSDGRKESRSSKILGRTVLHDDSERMISDVLQLHGGEKTRWRLQSRASSPRSSLRLAIWRDPSTIADRARHMACRRVRRRAAGTSPRVEGRAYHRGMPSKILHFELGRAQTVSPDDVLRGADDHVGRLMLTLGVAFNDLKGVMLGIELHRSARPLAQNDEEKGQLSGLQVQLTRQTIAIVHEILELLSKHRDTVDSDEFRAFVARLLPNSRKAWDALNATARRQVLKSTLARDLERCRSSFISHYDVDAIAGGFNAAFKKERGGRPAIAHGRPAFSEGENMEATRFYFADAALHGAAESRTRKPLDTIAGEALQLGRQVNWALGGLVVLFLRARCADIRPWVESGPLPFKL